MFGNDKYDKESLIEVFGTPTPSEEAIQRWRQSWKYDSTKILVPTFASAARTAKEAGIDSLFFQFNVVNDNLFVVLFKPEHEVFMKLHT
jgi:hypothetical protein